MCWNDLIIIDIIIGTYYSTQDRRKLGGAIFKLNEPSSASGRAPSEGAGGVCVCTVLNLVCCLRTGTTAVVHCVGVLASMPSNTGTQLPGYSRTLTLVRQYQDTQLYPLKGGGGGYCTAICTVLNFSMYAYYM
eukprot:SAG31_NODE_2285_length_6011_cov_5.276556_1_plen_133_part_00